MSQKLWQFVVVSLFVMSYMPFFVPQVLATNDSDVYTETTTSTKTYRVNNSTITITTTTTITTAKGTNNITIGVGTIPEIPEFGPGVNATNATLVIPESNATLVIPESD